MSDTRPLRNGSLSRAIIILAISATLGSFGWAVSWAWNTTQTRLDRHTERISVLERSFLEGAKDREWIRDSLKRIEGMVKESFDRERRR